MGPCLHTRLLVVLCLGFATFAHAESHTSRTGHKNLPARLPVTTASRQARGEFESGMKSLEELRREEALEHLRKAVKADPKFAQAWILIAHLSHDPDEQHRSRAHAEQLASRVTPSERLLIRWLAGAQEDNYVPAIAAMNDLLASYPRDQRLAFLAGRWVVHQERYGLGISILERAVKLAPDYPASLNELAYAYAYSGEYEKGLAVMEHYVALQPDQPNPHDSYGELLCLAGKFDAALEQYRTAIRLDPNFGSELGVANTLALMGREADARAEYELAAVFTGAENDKIDYELRSAVTWIRENNRQQAERALRDVSKHAHAAGLAVIEAEAHRSLALYEPDSKKAMKQLQLAEEAIAEHRLSQSDRNEEEARILQARAVRGADSQDLESATKAASALEAMAQTSRSAVIQLAYHAASGALLMAHGKYTEAIPHLEEDSANPLSMRLLWKAYDSTGASAQATALATRISTLYVPTVEQAVVVSSFRASLLSQVQPVQGRD